MSSEDSKKISLDLSKAWGAWKHQFTNCERILSFTSCGNHVSNVAYVEKTTGCLRNSTRMTGFSIQNVVNQNQDFDEGIEWILQNALKGKTVKYEVPQVLSFKDPYLSISYTTTKSIVVLNLQMVMHEIIL